MSLSEELDNYKLIQESILENSLAGYWDWHIKNNEEYLSPTLKKMFGYSNSELPNKPESWQKLIHPDDLPKARKAYKKHINSKGEMPYDLEVRYYHKNGSIVWVACKGQVVEWDADSKPVRMIGVHLDVSKSKNLEFSIRESEQRFRQLAEHIEEVFWITSKDGREFIYVSPSYEKVWQRGCDTLYASAANWLTSVHKDDQSRVYDEFVNKLENGDYDLDIEFRIIRPDDSIAWIRNRAFPIKNENGEVYRVAGISQDVTEYKSIESKLVSAFDGLEVKVKERTKELIKVNDQLREEIEQKKSVEKELRSSQAQLTKQKEELEKKNAALSEVLRHLESEKRIIEENIQSSVSDIVDPILSKLKRKGSAIDRRQIDLLDHSLENLVSPFANRVSSKKFKLTPREMEICNMIKDGLSSKDIAGLLSISFRTVEIQRTKIRKKLGISHKEVNLTTYLQSLK